VNGLSNLRMVGSEHMMSCVWDDPRHVTMLVLHKFVKFVRSNRCLIVQEISEECNISIGSCHEILTTKQSLSHDCHLSGTF
jgi:hypothetical protein